MEYELGPQTWEETRADRTESWNRSDSSPQWNWAVDWPQGQPSGSTLWELSEIQRESPSLLDPHWPDDPKLKLRDAREGEWSADQRSAAEERAGQHRQQEAAWSSQERLLAPIQVSQHIGQPGQGWSAEQALHQGPAHQHASRPDQRWLADEQALVHGHAVHYGHVRQLNTRWSSEEPFADLALLPCQSLDQPEQRWSKDEAGAPHRQGQPAGKPPIRWPVDERHVAPQQSGHQPARPGPPWTDDRSRPFSDRWESEPNPDADANGRLVEDLVKAFQVFDQDNDGLIDSQDIVRTFQDFGDPLDLEALVELFGPPERKVDFVQFWHAMQPTVVTEPSEVCRRFQQGTCNKKSCRFRHIRFGGRATGLDYDGTYADGRW